MVQITHKSHQLYHILSKRILRKKSQNNCIHNTFKTEISYYKFEQENKKTSAM